MKRLASRIFVASCLALVAQPSAAATYKFFIVDLPDDNVTAYYTVDSDATKNPVLPTGSIVPENFTLTNFTLFNGATLISDYSTSANFYERDKTTLSDTFSLTTAHPGATTFSMNFRSDGGGTLRAIGTSHINETGEPQTVALFTAIYHPSTLKTVTDTYIWSVTSDLDPVPEPLTWATMIVGFSGVGAMLRRRHRRLALV